MSNNTDRSRVAGARIQAQGFGWHHAGRERPIISELNFVIEPGQKVLLLGPSGAGKSTLLHAIAGVLNDEDGESQLGTLTLEGLAPEDARGVSGMMQQDPESSIVLAKVGDDIAFGPENLGVERAEIWQRVAESLQAVGLDYLELDHSTSALSGGQKQRLGLAGILAMHPGALLLDEPTANLDPAGVQEVRDAVLKAQELTGATLLVIEHRVAIWADAMDRIIVIGRNGLITHDGTPGEVLVSARQELIEAGVWVPDYLPALPHREETPGEVLIQAENLSISRSFPSRSQLRARRKAIKSGQQVKLDLPVVASRLSLAVRAGEHLSILGPNGAGKSTLALTLAGLLYPVAGSLDATPALRATNWADAAINSGANDPGSDIASWNPADLASRIGLVFQEPEQQFIKATVRDELEFGPRQIARIQKTELDEEELAGCCEELLDRLHLKDLEKANPFTLSGGEKRRLSVATALAAQPRVLVLDEPTFGQDAKTWHELVSLIRELLDAGIAVLSITHDLDFVRAVGGCAFYLGGEKSGTTLKAEDAL